MNDGRDLRDGGLSRRQLELVIRRAAELSAREGDVDERLSVDEVVRIAAEIGLPPHAVQQAVQEVAVGDPQDSRSARWIERRFGPAAVVCTRRLPHDSERALRMVEDHLVNREYMRQRRRTAGSARFEPADDALSTITRAISSVSRRMPLAGVGAVSVTALSDPAGGSHLQITLDLAHRRRVSVRTGLGVGAGIGAVAGAGVFVLVAVALAPLTAAVALAAGAVAVPPSIAGGAAIGAATAARSFRRVAGDAKLEAEGLLDRLERNEATDTPTGSFIRRIKSQVLGQLPSR